MEKVYLIQGLDCANCAAKLERHLKEISYFDHVIIDFMAQKLILTVKDEVQLYSGLEEAKKVINRIEPNVTITEKTKKTKISHWSAAAVNHVHNHGEACGCGHDHSHDAHSHGEACSCGHDHSHDAHSHGEACNCSHDHSHEEHNHGEACGCGHDHSHEGHDHGEHSHAVHSEKEKMVSKPGKLEYVYLIKGLDCANCAAKLERNLRDIPQLADATIDFMAQKLILRLNNSDDLETVLTEVQKVIERIEPGVTITEKTKMTKVAQEPTGTDNPADGQSAQQIDKSKKKAGKFTPEMQQSLLKIAISAALFLVAQLLPLPDLAQFGVFLLAYLIVGGEIVLRAVKNITRGQVFDENFLMSVATIGAFCVGEYPEGVMVMLLYQLGELFQDYAVHRSRRSIADLMDIKPEIAHVKQGDTYISVAPDEVAIGDIIQVRPGEKVPLDGVILEGASALDTVALTGEAVPRNVAAGQQVLSGCINISGVLTVRVEKEYEDSTVAKILDLVENASSKKADAENFITRFARYYTPVVVGVAVLLALVPPLVTGDPFSPWIYRALVFLVISCPCALVISIPLTFFSGLGACSRHGVLVKGSNYLEALAQLESAVFDKTGTLTKGQFAVTEIHTLDMTQEDLLYYAACAESISNHPIGHAVQAANQRPVTAGSLQKAEEIAGHGISAVVDGRSVLVGNYRLMEQQHISCERVEETGTIIYVAVDGVFCGWIVIADEIKPDAQIMIARLKELGVKQIVMLTGDNQKTAEKVAAKLGITKIFSQLLPGDKVTCLEEILQQKSKQGTVSFTGDGLNDAPVLARADVGVAMGGLGS
ncbi:MAG: heavy metal translocating P-type ATPase, partial [Peptococcaceae bacterium]